LPLLNWTARVYLWLLERLYNELAWAYDPISWAVSLGHWAAWQEAVFAHVTGTRVLEIGFGTGELLIKLARRDFTVIGLELSYAMHKITSAKLGRHGLLSLSRVRGKAQQLPFASEYFDTVIATFPAQYVFEPDTLGEVARVLHRPKAEDNLPGGRFIIVGLTADIKGKSVGGIHINNLKNLGERAIQITGWDIQIIKTQRAGFKLPIVVFERRE
jgi:ubiquinone/menaquinone biosynthesis C-methylase UbiE